MSNGDVWRTNVPQSRNHRRTPNHSKVQMPQTGPILVTSPNSAHCWSILPLPSVLGVEPEPLATMAASWPDTTIASVLAQVPPRQRNLHEPRTIPKQQPEKKSSSRSSRSRYSLTMCDDEQEAKTQQYSKSAWLAILTTTTSTHQCACRESNPGHKHGRLVWYRYTTCASPWPQTCKNPCNSKMLAHILPLLFGRNFQQETHDSLAACESFVCHTHHWRMRSEHAESTVKAARRATTAKGFAPSRAEPNGFLVHLLNHSDTLS